MPNPQTATERFIRKAVGGGYPYHWVEENRWFYSQRPDGREGWPLDKEKFLLDPKAWRCAGKTLGWPEDGKDESGLGFDEAVAINDWAYHWHGLLDHLADHPGDVEGYLAALLDAKGTE